MKRAIIVNGVPASGKSTVGDTLVNFLLEDGVAAVPLSLDTVKKGLFAHIGAGDREHNRLLGRASYHAIFSSVAAFPDKLVPVIDAWHGFQPREVLRGHLARADVEQVIEVWCRVSPETASARYRARAARRHAGHPPASYADELFELTKRARPMALGPVIEVDAERSVDPSALRAVCGLLNGAPPELAGAL